jgi:hypothetical protein
MQVIKACRGNSGKRHVLSALPPGKTPEKNKSRVHSGNACYHRFRSFCVHVLIKKHNQSSKVTCCAGVRNLL